MKVETPVFKCDAMGCESCCTLSPGEPEPEKQLALRGWLILNGAHYCPGCAARARANAAEPTDAE